MDIEAISVEELNKYIKDKLDNDEYLNNVLVKGEISNCKLHYTGHIYFTLLMILYNYCLLVSKKY